MTNAVLLRDVPLVVRDVSSGGCLIESAALLHVGMIGWLEVEFEDERRFEWFRVARVEARHNRVYVAGVEFLPLAAAGAVSMRSAIGRFRRSARAGKGDKVIGRVSRNHRRDARDAVIRSEPETTGPRARILDFARRRS
jgi:hypothetical protein